MLRRPPVDQPLGLRHQSFDQARQEVDERQKDDSCADIEQCVGDENVAGGIGSEVREQGTELGDERENRHRDGGTYNQVAEWHTARGDTGTWQVEIRGDWAADVGSDHQRERENGINRTAGGKRHDEQDDGEARVRKPGQDSGNQDCNRRFRAERRNDDLEHGAVAQGAGHTRQQG